jgi:alpha-tubulin suppressor-like RCC1 family protein
MQLAAEAALLGGAAQGGVKVSGTVGVGFSAVCDGDCTYSIPLSFDASFDFIGSLGWGLLSGRFPIWSWDWSGNLWTSGTAQGAMGLRETDADDLLLSDASTARSGNGEIGYAWTNIPLDGTPSPLSFQRQSQGVWGDVEQIASSAHHRGQPALISLDGERWMVLWSQSNLLADALGELTGEEVMAAQEIWYAVRDSEGWGPAQRLTENQLCDDSPAIVERSDGSVMAVWRQMSGLDLADLSASDLVYAVWDGVHWSAPGVLADTDAALTQPALAVLADGKVVAVWLSDPTGYGGEATVWSAVHDGTGWSPAVRISDEQAGLLAWPRMATLPDGRAIAFWTEEDARGTVLMMAVRDATSGQWSEPETATSAQRLIGKPEVVVDGSIVRVIYHGYAEGSEILVISRDFASVGSAWSEPEPVSSEGADAWWVSAAMDDAGVLQARYVVQASLEDSSMLPLPDLAVTAGSLSLEMYPPASGLENAVEAIVVNRGLIASEATTVSLYHGDPTAGGTHLLSEPLPALAVGEAVTVRLPWTPAVVANYALFVVVDDQAQVAELHEDNNTAQITVGVLAIPTIALAPESDTGLLGDGRTTVRRPMLQGEAGDAVTLAVFVDQLDGPVGYATLGEGTFSVVLPELDFGPATVWAQAFDASGNASPWSSPLELSIETTTLPSVNWLGLTEESDSGEVGDGLTNVNRPEIVGWGHPWAAMSIYENGQLLGETTADGQGGFHFTPAVDLHDGVRTITAVQRDDLGNVSPESLPWLLTIDTAAPSVEHVLLRGSAWTQNFLDYLDAEQLGHPSIPGLGYRVPDGPAQMDALPLTGVDTISVFFGEDVIVRIEGMTCHGTEHGDYTIAADGFVYDQESFSATWRLNEPIHRDTVLLKVGDVVTDLAGNALDGDWDDGQSEFPSGDGIPGGDFELSFVVWLNLAPVIETLTATPNPVFRPTTDVLLTAEANDPDGTVVSVEFYRDDQLLGTADGNDGWTWTVDTTMWQYGEHIVSARARDNDAAWSEWVSTTMTILNAPPVLTTIAPLAGAGSGEPFSISYAALMAASDASDADGDSISFRVETVTSGVLTMNGEPVTPGETLLSAEETWVWTPADGASGVVEGFTVVAWDGEMASSPAVAVQMLVDRTLDAVLVDGTLSIVDLHPDGQPNSMTIRLEGSDLVITDADEGFAFVPDGGGLSDNDRTLTIPLALVSSLVIDLAGGDDVLTVDFSGGNPIPPGGLYYDGGPGSDDLALSGGAFHISRFTYVNASDGEIILDPDGTATTVSSITYEGLAPITSSIASEVVELIYTGGDETITVSDAGGGQTTAVSTLGELTTFANPTELLRIVATGGTDTIDVGALATGYASFEIEGDDVTDVLNFNGAITFAANHGLTVSTVGTVNLPNAASDIAASGTGVVSITALRNIALAGGSSVIAEDGEINLSANQQATPTSGDFVGIDVDGATIEATGSGRVLLNGRGGDDAAGDQFGIHVRDGGQVIGGTSGEAVVIVGTGGTSAGDGNHGVQVSGSEPYVTSTLVPVASPGRTYHEHVSRHAFAALKGDGSVVTWGESLWGGGDSSGVAEQLQSGVAQIFSTQFSFAALKSDGSVVTWGFWRYGGDSSSVAEQLQSGVSRIFSTWGAFAALKIDGSVVSWGYYYGGDSSSVADQLQSDVAQIFSNGFAFAALKNDGSVVTWGDPGRGGDSSSVAAELESVVRQISSTNSAFAALKSDGSVVTWGWPSVGGDSSSVADQLQSGVSQIFSTSLAFAALKSDGSVVTWGDPDAGSDSSSVADQLESGISQIFSNSYAFAAVKSDGSVVTWGQSGLGGDSSGVAEYLQSDISHIFAASYAFAALKSDGSVVTWPSSSSYGGDSSAVADQLQGGVSQIFSTGSAFVALKTDGSVVTWGSGAGDSSSVTDQLQGGVSQIFSTASAFAALKTDGSVVTWGSSSSGDSSSVAGELQSGVVGFANPFTDDWLMEQKARISSRGGNVSIAGISGEGADSLAIHLGDSGVITTGQHGGDVSLTGNRLAIGATATVSVNRSSSVGIAPYEAGGTISLGDKPAGALGLTQAELDRITAGVLRLGDASSGAITVSVPISRAVATDVHLTTGETMTRIDMTIVREPSATDGKGEVETLPGSAEWVHEWESFWVEIWVSTPDFDGVGGRRGESGFAVLQRLPDGPGDRLRPGMGASGDRSTMPGNFVTLHGQDGTDRRRRRCLRPAGSGPLRFDRRRPGAGGAGRRFPRSLRHGDGLANGQTRLVDGTAPVPALGESPDTELWAVMYDFGSVVSSIEENNQIDFGDFSFFAAAFGKLVGPSHPPYTAWADFDRSGRVDFGDLAFFAPNFGKTRAGVQSGAQTLVFPPNFPGAWRAGQCS